MCCMLTLLRWLVMYGIFASWFEQQAGQGEGSLDLQTVFVDAFLCQPAAGHLLSLQFQQ